MRGLNRADNGGGLLRNNGAEVSAGAQGEGGAPWFFTTRYGILIDSDGGSFLTSDGAVDFSSGSRYDTEYFVVVGRPLEVVAGLSLLTGRPPLPPKWSLGFLNSQWERMRLRSSNSSPSIGRSIFHSMVLSWTTTGRRGVKMTTANGVGTVLPRWRTLCQISSQMERAGVCKGIAS